VSSDGIFTIAVLGGDFKAAGGFRRGKGKDCVSSGFFPLEKLDYKTQADGH